MLRVFLNFLLELLGLFTPVGAINEITNYSYDAYLNVATIHTNNEHRLGLKSDSRFVAEQLFTL